ncbi:hypothetical protein C0J52_24943 [Blattella germanica]|nr:hypothetical protein C0J52_24943 [Blattella germanica]
MDNLLIAINTLKLAHLPNTTLIAVHLTSPTPFIPPNIEHFTTEPTTISPSTESHSNPEHSRTNKRHSPDNTPSQKIANEPATMDPEASHISTPSDLKSASEYNDAPSYFTTDDPFTSAPSKMTQTGRLPRSISSSNFQYTLDGSGEGRNSHKQRRYMPPADMSQATKRAMLVLTTTDIAVNVDEFFSPDRRHGSSSNWTRYPEVNI